MTLRTSLLCIAGLLTAGLLWVLHSGVLDKPAQEYTDQGLQRVMLTYAVARGLNGLISVVQGTEVSVEPAGVGMTFTPGQILDPVNDLIEQFSSLVLISGVSLGVQRLLITMTAAPLFNWLVTVVLIITLALHFWKTAPQQFKNVATRIAMVLLVLRLAVPVISLLNQTVYWYFLQSQYETAQTTLEQSGNQLQQQQQKPPASLQTGDQSILDKVKRAYHSASDTLDFDARLDHIKQTAASMSEKILDLMVVFMVQTLVFPLVFLWLAYRLLLQSLRLV